MKQNRNPYKLLIILVILTLLVGCASSPAKNTGLRDSINKFYAKAVKKRTQDKGSDSSTKGFRGSINKFFIKAFKEGTHDKGSKSLTQGSGSSIKWNDYRAEKSLQFQIDPVGLGVQQGVRFGYHINKRFYVGIERLFKGEGRYGLPNRPPENIWKFDRNGVVGDRAYYPKRDILDIRISPWDFGLFFSFGIIKSGEDREEIVFDRRQRSIGSNSYDTGLNIQMLQEPYTAPTIGLGINHVYRNGFSFSLGMLVVIKNFDQNVTVTTTNSSVIVVDQNELKREVEIYLKDHPWEETSSTFFHTSIGYNF